MDEATAWERIAEGALPKLWEGPTQGVPLVHKQGVVWVVLATQTLPVDDAAPMIKLLEAGQKRGAYPDARGRFSVSPGLNVVLKRGASPKDPERQITFALGRLEGPPTWAGKGEEPKEVAAGSIPSAAASSSESAALSRPTQSTPTQSPHTLSKPAPKKTSDGKSTTPLFVLVQEGYLAAVVGDHAELERVAEVLSGQRKAWIHEAVQMIAEGTEWPAGADETPPYGMESLLPYAGKAFVSGRTDLLRRACESFKVGQAQKPKRVAIANALAILARKADEVWGPEE
ncbi:MAG: hypothetical protein ACI89X_004351 [Planctomycetota bacterium]